MSTPETSALSVLVVDSPGNHVAWDQALGGDFSVHRLSDAAAALNYLEQNRCAILIAHSTHSNQVLPEVAERWPDTLRIVVAPHDDVAAAVRAINEDGVFGFLPLPLDDDLAGRLFDKVRSHVLAHKEQVETIDELRAALSRMHDQIAAVERQSVASQASIDEATDLWDRQYLIERIEDETNRLERYKIPFGVVSIDVSAEPPHLETAAAELLQNFVRRVDVSARFEPCCFVVLCPSTDDAGMRVLPGRLERAFSQAALPGSAPGELPTIRIATVTLDNGPVPTDEVLVRLMTARARAASSGAVVHYNDI